VVCLDGVAWWCVLVMWFNGVVWWFSLVVCFGGVLFFGVVVWWCGFVMWFRGVVWWFGLVVWFNVIRLANYFSSKNNFCSRKKFRISDFWIFGF
jgi:hypothetical protein